MQNSSSLSKEFIEITFKYEFLLGTPPRRTFRPMWKSISCCWKITNFRDEFFSGSSDFKDEIWSEMESLGVLDVFCTYSECATTSTSKFSKMSIFIIFSTFFPKMFEKMVKISTRSSSGWVLGDFWDRTWS